MPSVAVLGPVILPLAAASVLTVFGLAGLDLGRAAAAAGSWASVIALLAVWIPVRSSVELTLGPLGFGSAFDLRVDGVTFAFGLMVATPAAILLTRQPRQWPQSVLSLLSLAAAMAAVEAGGVVLTAIAGGTAATLAVVLLDTENPRAPRPSWAMLLAGWLALAWFGVILQIRGGTAVYSAVPVATVTGPLFVLLAASAILASSLFPWRGWPAALWRRPSLRAAGITVATLYPLGFYLLVRAYELGNGRYPHPLYNVLLAVVGITAAFAAGARAQAAPTRREFLGEVVPGLGGFALMATALGTPLGLVGGLILVMTASVLVAAVALLPDAAGVASLVVIAAAVGLPPGIAFAARVLGIGATFEAGDFLGLIGVAAAATWATWMVGGARAIGLPGGRGHPAEETSPRVALLIGLGVLVAGPALATLKVAYADPVTAEVLESTASTPTGGFLSVVTVSSVLPAVTLLVPLLLFGVAAYLVAGTSKITTQSRPALFPAPAADTLARLRKTVRAATVPEQYRTILNLKELEAAAADGRAVLWFGALVALAFAVTR
ncbi:MAG TPA: hypothetical protein VJR46_01070 [Candidatus Dormibacteraeota bacterium]|nr:hypothetical protein [Candidatus Dormibacteraeota bacterium]